MVSKPTFAPASAPAMKRQSEGAEVSGMLEAILSTCFYNATTTQLLARCLAVLDTFCQNLLRLLLKILLRFPGLYICYYTTCSISASLPVPRNLLLTRRSTPITQNTRRHCVGRSRASIYYIPLPFIY